MRLEFLTDDNPLYVLPLFEEFVKNYADEFPISRISLCRPMGKRSRIQLLKQLTTLYGIVGMVRILARFAKARCLGVLPRRRGASRFDSLTQLSRSYGIVCEKIGSPNSQDFRSAMAERAPDVLISVACPYVLKGDVLSIPRMGCINIHHAPLPRYKGMMPTFWQMFHGEKKVGITVHTMVEAVDAGQALLQEEMLIESGESLDNLIRRSKVHGAHCLVRVLRQLRDGQPNYTSLDDEVSTYFTFPSLAEIVEFKRRGLKAL